MMEEKNKFAILKEAVGGFKQSTWIEDTKKSLTDEGWRRKSQMVAMVILRTLRSKSMSQSKLAEIMGVSPQQVSKWVKGSENFTFETISRLEAALSIELLEIKKIQKLPYMKVFYMEQTHYHRLDFECQLAEKQEAYA